MLVPDKIVYSHGIPEATARLLTLPCLDDAATTMKRDPTSGP
jgi:hypothetical protein